MPLTADAGGNYVMFDHRFTAQTETFAKIQPILDDLTITTQKGITIRAL